MPQHDMRASKPKARLKRGRPLGSKDRNPRKRKSTNDQNDTMKGSPEETQNLISSEIPEEINEPEAHVSEELLISSNGDGINLNRSEIVVDNIFAYNVALNIMQDSEDLEPRSVEECRQRSD